MKGFTIVIWDGLRTLLYIFRSPIYFQLKPFHKFMWTVYSLVRIWLLLEFLSHFFYSHLCAMTTQYYFGSGFFFAAIYHSYNSYMYLRCEKTGQKVEKSPQFTGLTLCGANSKFSQLFSQKAGKLCLQTRASPVGFAASTDYHIAHQPQPGLGSPLSKCSVFQKPHQLAKIAV